MSLSLLEINIQSSLFITVKWVVRKVRNYIYYSLFSIGTKAYNNRSILLFILIL